MLPDAGWGGKWGEGLEVLDAIFGVEAPGIWWEGAGSGEACGWDRVCVIGVSEGRFFGTGTHGEVVACYVIGGD